MRINNDKFKLYTKREANKGVRATSEFVGQY